MSQEPPAIQKTQTSDAHKAPSESPPSPSPRTWLGAWLIVGLALVVRLAWVWLVPSKPVGDFAMYIESATHLRAHGALDDTFTYMPGYVLLLALVQTLGGGLFACKLVGVALGTATAGFVVGITRSMWDGRAAVLAGLLAAVWPGAVMVSSVTGTDTPSTAFLLGGIYALVRLGKTRPWTAAIAFGIGMGLAAYVRAVALPLAALGFFYLWAVGADARRSILRTAIATGVALLVLLPWGLRNHGKYGTWIFTDSHGGLTALVGAYPNSDGQYTRALNRTFEEVTGMRWLQPPHREADRTAYALAQTWTALERPFALGLATGRAEKLLGDERSLLYWPLYRHAVLTGDNARFWNRWRREVETIVDGYYIALMALCLAGLGLAVGARRWSALTLWPFQVALCGVYILYFAESRYHLPIAALAFPSAAAFVIWLGDVLRAVVRARSLSAVDAGTRRKLLGAVVVPVVALSLFATGTRWGAYLRERHRWAVHACTVQDKPNFCTWRRGDVADTPSPVLGVFDGVGLRLDQGSASAETSLTVTHGAHAIHVLVDVGGPGWETVASAQNQGSIVIENAGTGARAQVSLAQAARGTSLTLTTKGATGTLPLRVMYVSGDAPPPHGTSVWFTKLRVD